MSKIFKLLFLTFSSHAMRISTINEALDKVVIMDLETVIDEDHIHHQPPSFF
jgi:hypothetical protein